MTVVSRLQAEGEVRRAIRGEIKAVYDARCTDLFHRARVHLRSRFQDSEGVSETLSVPQLQQRTDPGVWTLYSGQPSALDPSDSAARTW